MNIVMITNTYRPHVGGVANSVYSFSTEIQKHGHRIIVICPEFKNSAADSGPECIRVPAIQNFNASDFSVALPFPTNIIPRLDEFDPDIIHAHHPFLLGDTAFRLAAHYDIPLVFTHHTMYESYTHYVPGDSEKLKQYVIELATGYANLCDTVVAPSESVAKVLLERGVHAPIEIVPTGVDVKRYATGDGQAVRSMFRIPKDAFVVGHVGRLSPEKNLEFLARAVAEFMKDDRNSYFLVVGDGSSRNAIRDLFHKYKLQGRLRLAGSHSGQELINAYHAMDVFVFASQTETQGMVLTEAMACGCPVIAVDAPGAREVVESGKNGTLLEAEDVTQFANAIRSYRNLDATSRSQQIEAARTTAERFSIENTTNKVLEVYQRVTTKPVLSRITEDSPWWRSLRKIEAEWEIWSNRASSATEAWSPVKYFKFPSFVYARLLYRRIRRAFNRNELLVRLFGLTRNTVRPDSTGLVIIQIDGLARKQLELALNKKRMPFLRRLLNREHYELHTLYSGVPSTTPVVQGELFYGKRPATPAFQFYDRSAKRVVTMIEPDAVVPVEQKLADHGEGLLLGGSSYSNIYAGGAAESHYCAASLGWGEVQRALNPWAIIVGVLSNFWTVVRVVALIIIEFFLTLIDFVVGINRNFHLARELKFIPVRVLVSILLRELITIGTCADVARGVPVIYLNYLGYDEQSHRRGPSSRFAHWTLKGIDSCIQRIWRSCQLSRRRYEVWICSDHGQEKTIPFANLTGMSLVDAVAASVAETGATPTAQRVLHHDAASIGLRRAGWLGGKHFTRFLNIEKDRTEEVSEIVVTDMGPLGHIYLPDDFPIEQRDGFCSRLASVGKIPLVIARTSPTTFEAWRGTERFSLPEDAEKVFGAGHPFLREVTRDVFELSRHPNAGDILMFGWRPDKIPVSFATENGGHAGPGFNETAAFCLVPANTVLPTSDNDYISISDMRMAALHTLGRRDLHPHRGKLMRHRVDSIRLATYNVHSCVGTDGRLSPSRIAKVLRGLDVDIVCLQEVDVQRKRSNFGDQEQLIAQELGFNVTFFPTIEREDEKYGDAILSRFPIRLVKAEELPTDRRTGKFEPRGAIWAELELPNGTLQIINTHLGLRFAERKVQVDTLLGPSWLGDPKCKERTVFCGDLNALPRSYVHKRLSRQLIDAQQAVAKHRPRKTFPSGVSIGRIDHVFTTPDIEIVHVDVPKTTLTRSASDHLPVVVEFSLP